MSAPAIALLLAAWLALLGGLGFALRRQMRRTVSRRCLAEGVEADRFDEEPLTSKSSWLRRRLHRAGFRRLTAPFLFAMAQPAALAIGGTLAAVFLASGAVQTLDQLL